MNDKTTDDPDVDAVYLEFLKSEPEGIIEVKDLNRWLLCAVLLNRR